ncbi:MAG: hypothetical protein OEZ59_01500, partial [Deltaproteobacteria bacterium]|nr:hypothetical protein [Deltaproteobacteria bacterium]
MLNRNAVRAVALPLALLAGGFAGPESLRASGAGKDGGREPAVMAGALDSAISPSSTEWSRPYRENCPAAPQAVLAVRPVPLREPWVPLRATYLEALCHEAAGRPLRALPFFEQGAQQPSPVRYLFQLGMFRSRLALGEHEAAISSLTEMLRSQPPEWLQNKIGEFLEDWILGTRPPAPEIQFEYLSAYEQFSSPGYNEASLLEHLLELAVPKGDAAQIKRILIALWENPSDKEGARKWASLEKWEKKYGPLELTGEHYKSRAARLFKLRLYAQLTRELESPDLPPMTRQTAWELGRYYFRGLIQGRELAHAAVQIHTPPVTKRFQFTKRQVLIWSIRIQLRRNKLGPALKLLQDLEEISPRDEDLPELFFQVAEAHQRRGNQLTLRHWYERIITEFPGSGEASEAYWKMFWAAYQSGYQTVAEEILSRATGASESFHPVDKARLWYWKGRMQMDSGQREQGLKTWGVMRQRWPYGYYSALSELMENNRPLRLSGGANTGLPAANGSLPGSQAVSAGEPAKPHLISIWEVEAFSVALFLFSVGERDIAVELLRH